MNAIYTSILHAKKNQKKLLAILIDPDKTKVSMVQLMAVKINQSPADFVFVGGSSVQNENLDNLIVNLKKFCKLPILLFPGSYAQISGHAHGILFLSLISGRNPDFLIDNQIKAVPILKKTNLEIISTAYILIKTGSKTAVEVVSKTESLSQTDTELIIHTAQAGELLGHKLIYLEAGSGADQPISDKIIKLVAQNVSLPLIVGGGIKSLKEIQYAYQSGADLVVIGTAFENDTNFFEKQN